MHLSILSVHPVISHPHPLSLLSLYPQVCSDVDKQLIFDEIIPSAHLLMTDVFGNYVIQVRMTILSND